MTKTPLAFDGAVGMLYQCLPFFVQVTALSNPFGIILNVLRILTALYHLSIDF